MAIEMFRIEKRRYLCSRRCLAFSLLEIIFAMTVLVILVALLLSAVTSARNSANTAKCTANLKRIGETLSLYLNDHNGTLPNLPLVPRNQNELLLILGDYMDKAPRALNADHIGRKILDLPFRPE